MARSSKKADTETEQEVAETPEVAAVAPELTFQKKAAVIVAALGADSASKVYKYLSEEDVEKLTLELAKLGHMSSDDTSVVMDDFYKACLTQKVVTEGGIEYARAVLERTYGEAAAAELLKKMNRYLKNRSFEFIQKMDTKSLYSVLQRERPQAIALILSYAEPGQAAALISELPDKTRIKVVQSIAQMESASPEVIRAIESSLLKKFDSVLTTDFTEIGGIDYIADVMNHMDRSNEKFIFDEMSKVNPLLAEEIRKKMFVFEDILLMDSHSIQRFIRDCNMKDIVYALKSSSQEIMDVFFANMSSRMAETIKSDLEITFNVRLRDVEEAQQRIVNIIRKLEEEGEIVVGKGGGGDDIIV